MLQLQPTGRRGGLARLHLQTLTGHHLRWTITDCTVVSCAYAPSSTRTPVQSLPNSIQPQVPASHGQAIEQTRAMRLVQAPHDIRHVSTSFGCSSQPPGSNVRGRGDAGEHRLLSNGRWRSSCRGPRMVPFASRGTAFPHLVSTIPYPALDLEAGPNEPCLLQT